MLCNISNIIQFHSKSLVGAKETKDILSSIFFPHYNDSLDNVDLNKRTEVEKL